MSQDSVNVTIEESVEQISVSVENITDTILIDIIDDTQTILVEVSEIGQQGFNGKSAYEIAVQNGFLGTEQQWINGLGSSKIHIKNENPTGIINGINPIFTSLNNFEAESVEVFLNGIIQQKITEFQTIGSKTIILNISPSFGETISINYIKL
jgi:hypothetical protein